MSIKAAARCVMAFAVRYIRTVPKARRFRMDKLFNSDESIF
jgi:hypothetical protein